MQGLPEEMLFWVKRTYLAARKALDHALQEHGLTGSQLELLRHVLLQPGIEQREIQERLQVSSATVTGLVDGLVQRGLVERVVHAQDARVKQLFATSDGRSMGDEVDRKAAAIQTQMLRGFSPAEQAMAREFFARMVQNLGGHTDDGS